jgi:DNA-binding MarR family transcriptional regulator
LTIQELTALHNQLSKNPIKKFLKRPDAEKKLLALEKGRSREQMVEAATAARIRPVLIRQWSYLKGPDVALDIPTSIPQPKSKKQEAKKKSRKTVERSLEQVQDTLDKIHGVPPKEKEPKEPKAVSNGRTLNDKEALVLLTIREMIPETASGDDAQVSTDDLAKKLNTTPNLICKIVEKLDNMNLVGMEDDSPDDNHRFYYASLTDAGRTFDVNEKKASKAPLPGSNPGPRSNLSGKHIYRISKTNPRREGTHGYKSFALIKDGMTFEAYRQAGGRNNDLAWDLDHGFVEMRDK